MYCSNCGNKLEIEVDFKREPICFSEKGVRLKKNV